MQHIIHQSSPTLSCSFPWRRHASRPRYVSVVTPTVIFAPCAICLTSRFVIRLVSAVVDRWRSQFWSVPVEWPRVGQRVTDFGPSLSVSAVPTTAAEGLKWERLVAMLWITCCCLDRCLRNALQLFQPPTPPLLVLSPFLVLTPVGLFTGTFFHSYKFIPPRQREKGFTCIYICVTVYNS